MFINQICLFNINLFFIDNYFFHLYSIIIMINDRRQTKTFSNNYFLFSMNRGEGELNLILLLTPNLYKSSRVLFFH